MFEYYYYQQAVQKASLGLLLISAAAGVLAFVWAERSQPDYQVHYSYLVSLSERETANDFRYDGYYALSATDLFAATLAAWVKTPEVIAEAYRRASLAIPSDEPRALLKTVTADKTGPQLVQITVRHPDKEAALRLAEGLQAVMQENVTRYHQEGIPALKFNVVPTAYWIGVNRVAVLVIAFGTFIIVLLAGINIVLLRASLRAGAENIVN